MGQHPKTWEWSLVGEVSEVAHGERAYIVTYHEGGSRMFSRPDLKLDNSGRFGYTAAEMRELEKYCQTEEEKPGFS